MNEAKLQAAIAGARTTIVRAIFPDSTNHYDTLFGGNTLKWMDEVAFITATRLGRKKFVTVSSDRVDFNMPIPGGHFAELIGEVVKVGNSSCIVEVKLMLEGMYEEGQVEAVKGSFTLVAIDDDRKAIPIFS